MGTRTKQLGFAFSCLRSHAKHGNDGTRTQSMGTREKASRPIEGWRKGISFALLFSITAKLPTYYPG